MFYLFRELKLRPVLTGVLSLVPNLYDWWDSHRPMGNTSSAPYSRRIWRIHLENYRNVHNGKMPEAVAEFGPGATLGACIAALCDGVNEATGLDVCPYASDNTENSRILEELLSQEEASRDTGFLQKAVSSVGSKQETVLKYVAPWNDLSILPESSLDLIFSHSVMEHVDDPAEAYKACFHWLKPGGIISHKIDHSSHGVTKSWNGHYGIPKVLWKIIVGKRPYLLNRMTPLQHQTAIESAGFRILSIKSVKASESDNNYSQTLVRKNADCWIKTSTFICKKAES